MIARTAAAAILMTLLAAAPAGAESGRLADFSVGLTSRTPASPTGITLHVLFHRADDPNAKPAALRTAVFQAPAGLRFDSAALPQCTASDAEIQAQGSSACPADTQLTVGRLTAITGFGPPADPIAGDDHVFNAPDQIIEVITAPGAPASPGFDRLTIDGSTLTAHPPTTPGGPPDGQTAIRSIDFAIPVRTNGARSLITAPPSCPAGGRWTSTGHFGFADGTSDTVATVTPCTATAAAKRRLRVAVRPRRVSAGRRTRFHVRLRSADPSCVARARVHFAGRAVHTDSRGNATLAATLTYGHERRLRASHAGCGRATTAVRVR
jgi:hypothetical protein